MIQTEITPNPNSLKFLSEKVISVIGTEEFHKSKINEVSNPFIKEMVLDDVITVVQKENMST